MAEEIFSLTPIQPKKGSTISLSLKKSKKQPSMNVGCNGYKPLSKEDEKKFVPQSIASAESNFPMVQIPSSSRKGIRIKSVDELRTPAPSNQNDNKHNEQVADNSEIIEITSDDEIFEDNKADIKAKVAGDTKSRLSKTPTRRARKRAAKTDVKIEKITTVRKLTNSTNLKTFNSKYMPPSQQSIHKYFDSVDKSERMGYFETFEESSVRKSPPRKKLQPINLNSKFVETSENESKPGVSLVDEETRENVPRLLEYLKSVSAYQESPSISLHNSSMFRGMDNDCMERVPPLDAYSRLNDEKQSKDEDAKDSACYTDQSSLQQANQTEPISESSSQIRPRYGRARKRPAISSSQETIPNENENGDGTVIDLCDSQTPEKKAMKSNGQVATKTIENKIIGRHKDGKTTPIKKARGRKGDCPSYKIVKDTTFAVDAFRYGDIEGVTHYFLSHFHADHYIGLSKKFRKPVYLSAISARLVQKFLRTNQKYLHVIDVNCPIVINGVEVIAVDANHCPGALMFIFKFESGLCTLHTGDFRACAEMEEGPVFWDNFIQTIYLDTTYLSSKYAFKSQPESIDDAVCAISEFRERHIGEKILYIFGTYVIGKERMWSRIAEEYDFKVWTDDNRKKALEAIGNEEYLKRLVDNPHEADMHILTLGNISYDYLSEYLKQFCEFNMILAIRASGWEKDSKPQFRGNVNIIGIPYSEHSSYGELRRFVRFLQPSTIISTVPKGVDVNVTSKIPLTWYSNELRVWQKGYQRSITNYVHIRDSRKNLPPSTSRLINDVEDAKRYDSADELNVLDATLTTNTSAKHNYVEIAETISDWLP